MWPFDHNDIEKIPLITESKEKVKTISKTYSLHDRRLQEKLDSMFCK